MQQSLKYRSVIAAICGNFIEWYDFALYLLLAPILAHHFFPESAKEWALLGTLTVYAVSFFFRPLGGILFGHLGDRFGRRFALRWSISCLTGLSIVLACLPDYHQVGVRAIVLLCLCRIGQGLCLGGEFAGSMIYLSEIASPSRRAFFASLSNNGSNFGIMVASLSTVFLSALLGETAFAAYGYRVLFFIGGIVGLIGFGYRSDLEESLEFVHCFEREKRPLFTVFRHHKQSLWRLFLIVGIGAVGSYALMGYVSIFLQQKLGLSLAAAIRYETFFITLSLCLVPFFAVIADRITPKILLTYTCWLYIVCSIPCFYGVYHFQEPLYLTPLFLIYSIEEACIPSMMRDYFPASIRYTGVSLSYNLSMGFIGGLSPILGQFFIFNLQLSYGVAYLLMVFSLLTLAALFFNNTEMNVDSKAFNLEIKS